MYIIFETYKKKADKEMDSSKLVATDGEEKKRNRRFQKHFFWLSKPIITIMAQ